ncbi:DUF3310 domain-containing protein [Nocardia ignorata]|uniref:Uncharacterized protein DUF3310 n=1 Tax=Nocardia ignorata TaxID=145285 RepID=A0A4R6NZU2_NOCIG|nr:DUF3310 domain-containing protein [Nocardia ignorata]TDP29868.1 uncharacterized protein DUF3310 [Nocardia ignorata]
MTDVVNHPVHYSTGRFTCECITITRHLTFTAGNAVKYCWRFAEKNGAEDLRKAVVYLRWAVEDGTPAILAGHEDTVRSLVVEHVIPHADGVYGAIERVVLTNDYTGALNLIEAEVLTLSGGTNRG